MADNSLPTTPERDLNLVTYEQVKEIRVIDTSDNSKTLAIDNLTIAGTKVTVAVDGLSGTVDGAFGDVLTAIAEKADTTQVEALDAEKLDITNVYNGLDKTAAGFALDARQGKALDDVDKANYAKSVEMIAHDATAPSPIIPTGTTKTYEFSSGGVCTWLANQVVEKGDKVAVSFTAPSTFVRTYQNVVSRKVDDTQIKQTTGTSETDVMSQKAVTNEINLRPTIDDKTESNSLYIKDVSGNVCLVVKEGEVYAGNFASTHVRENMARIARLGMATEDKTLISRKNVPRISWIDDDLNVSDAENVAKLNILRAWANSHNIRPDIALIPSYTFTDETNTDIESVYFTNERLDLVKELAKEGFNYLLHPIHTGMYNNEWNIYISDAYATKNIAMCIRAFRENAIKGDNIYVYAGSSAAIEHNVAIARSNFDCAITPWDTSSIPSGVNIGTDHDRYELARFSLDRLATQTVSEIKSNIDAALSNGAWIIFVSHYWGYSGDGTEPVTEAGQTFSNLFDVITYANSKSQIVPVQQVWNERKILWEFYENNKKNK